MSSSLFDALRNFKLFNKFPPPPPPRRSQNYQNGIFLKRQHQDESESSMQKSHQSRQDSSQSSSSKVKKDDVKKIIGKARLDSEEFGRYTFYLIKWRSKPLNESTWHHPQHLQSAINRIVPFNENIKDKSLPYFDPKYMLAQPDYQEKLQEFVRNFLEAKQTQKPDSKKIITPQKYKIGLVSDQQSDVSKDQPFKKTIKNNKIEAKRNQQEKQVNKIVTEKRRQNKMIQENSNNSRHDYRNDYRDDYRNEHYDNNFRNDQPISYVEKYQNDYRNFYRNKYRNDMQNNYRIDFRNDIRNDPRNDYRNEYRNDCRNEDCGNYRNNFSNNYRSDFNNDYRNNYFIDNGNGNNFYRRNYHEFQNSRNNQNPYNDYRFHPNNGRNPRNYNQNPRNNNRNNRSNNQNPRNNPHINFKNLPINHRGDQGDLETLYNQHLVEQKFNQYFQKQLQYLEKRPKQQNKPHMQQKTNTNNQRSQNQSILKESKQTNSQPAKNSQLVKKNQNIKNDQLVNAAIRQSFYSKIGSSKNLQAQNKQIQEIQYGQVLDSPQFSRNSSNSDQSQDLISIVKVQDWNTKAQKTEECKQQYERKQYDSHCKQENDKKISDQFDEDDLVYLSDTYKSEDFEKSQEKSFSEIEKNQCITETKQLKCYEKEYIENKQKSMQIQQELQPGEMQIGQQNLLYYRFTKIQQENSIDTRFKKEPLQSK